MAAFGLKIKLSQYALPMLVIGVLGVLQRGKRWQGAGRILVGFAFIFLGIDFLKNGFEGLRASIDLTQYAFGGILGLLVFTLIGVIATVVMQSSHATLMLIITGLAAGQITYENALALAIGANIGTTVTAFLGSLSANVEGKRLAGAHLIFNTITALIALLAITPFRWTVDSVASSVGIAPDNWTLKLALFHTLFNVVGVLVMVPVIPWMVRFLERHILPVPDPSGVRPKFLNDAALLVPEGAIEAIRNETLHLFDSAFKLIAHGINVHRHEILSERPIHEICDAPMEAMRIDVANNYYFRVKTLYNEVIAFAARAQLLMSGEQSRALYGIRIAARDIARVVKSVGLISANINRYGQSPIPALRSEYTHIRRVLATLLRELYRTRLKQEAHAIAEHLQAMRDTLNTHDALASGKLDHLIRSGKLSKEAATSLMNDNAVTLDIGELLIEIAVHLSLPREIDRRALSEDLKAPAFSEDTYGEVFAEGQSRDEDTASLTGEYRRITAED